MCYNFPGFSFSNTNYLFHPSLLPGFGVFGNSNRSYSRNPSWEAVNLMQVQGVNLVKIHVPVEYDAVVKVVSDIWNHQEKPDLVIHCGVSHLAEGVVLEKMAHGHGYLSFDVKGCKPGEECLIDSTPLSTELNVDLICENLHRSLEEGMITLPAATSKNAGRYLCEYIYFQSLTNDTRRTLFIHVPEETKFSVQETARALECTVQCLLNQLDNQGGDPGEERTFNDITVI